MKNFLLLAILPFAFAACDKSGPAPAEKVIEKNTTVVQPGQPAPEKKVENNTTVVNPAPAPAKEVKKETNTTIVNPPAK